MEEKEIQISLKESSLYFILNILEAKLKTTKNKVLLKEYLKLYLELKAYIKE